MCSDMLKEDTADHLFPEVLGTVPSHEDVVKETDISFKVNEVETSVDQGEIVHRGLKKLLFRYIHTDKIFQF